MRWISMAAAALIAGGGQAARADVIVVRSNGPSAARLPPGKTLSDNTRLTLQRGDQIVLLDARGTRTVTGPAVVSAAGDPSRAAPTALSAVIGPSTSRRSRVGAVRGMSRTPPATSRPGIFLVDVTKPGRMCVVDPAAVTMWRADASAAAATVLTAGDGRSATVNWIAGQNTAPWPTALPVAQGASYQLLPARGGLAVTIEFQTLAAPPANLQQLAAGLITHGCQAQVDVLVATTSAAPVPGTGG